MATLCMFAAQESIRTGAQVNIAAYGSYLIESTHSAPDEV